MEETCGDVPCGYVGPLSLSCDGSRLSGSALLAVDSRRGKEYRAPVSATWENGRLKLKHTDQQCVVIYDLSVEGIDMIGEYTREGCGDKGERGSVILKKSPYGHFRKKL